MRYCATRQPTERAKYSYFYIIWSLKEAFIKAIGQGLGYDLREVRRRYCGVMLYQYIVMTMYPYTFVVLYTTTIFINM